MGLTPFTDHGFEVDIGSAVCAESGIEDRRRLPAGRTFLVRFESTLDDIRDGTTLPSGKAMGEVSCPGASDGELGFGPWQLLAGEYGGCIEWHQDGI